MTQSGTDPSLMGHDEYLRHKLDQNEEELKYKEQRAEHYQAVEAQDKALAEAPPQDSRDDGPWDLGDYAKEAGSIVGGGLQDTASSIVTAPERFVDMITGEYQEEVYATGRYRPDFDPFTDPDNPIITKTWAGNLLRGMVHYGTMMMPLGALGKAATGVQATTKMLGWGGRITRSMATGAGADLLSRNSQDDNLLGVVKQKWSWIDTPISTNEYDHPLMKTFKNVVEGMGIGVLFDGLQMSVGKGWDGLKAKREARIKSIKDQAIEKGKLELDDPNPRGHKNNNITGSHQGSPTSNGAIDDVRGQLKQIRTDYGAEEGSTDSLLTPVQLERWGLAEAEEFAKGVLSSSKYQAEIAAVKAGQSTMADAWIDTMEQVHRITQGRNAIDTPTEDYFKEFFAAAVDWPVMNKGAVVDTITTWLPEQLGSADLVVGTLLREIRDLGISGREIENLVDLNAADGPAKAIYDKIITALTETKRTRMVMSDQFRKIGVGKTQRQVRKNIDDALVEEMDRTKESLKSMLKLAADADSPDLTKALWEVFSGIKEVNQLEDFEHWVKKSIKGGEIDGVKKTGALIRELGTMFSHSVLSGPKTPIRAMMGTSTATFLRPLSMAIGAGMRGDGVAARAGLSSLNAMMEAIPESFNLFKTRLNSYWNGDISTIRTRFYESTKADDQWDLIGKFIETDPNVDFWDKIWYRTANQARAWNNSKFLTYSTKLMAATDDSFAFILGRAEMRRRSYLEAMENFNKGELTEITPEMLRQGEEKFYAEIFDANGNIKDAAIEAARKEVTLTQDLTGFSKNLADVFNSFPLAKPFFLFARTGVNGLQLTAKHTPVFNRLVREVNDIRYADINAPLTHLNKYGIYSPEDLMNARDLSQGRIAMGYSLISLASWSYMSGNLTGNGPTDRQKRQVWLDAGWLPRSINIGGVWVGYDSMEPFNQIFSIIGDIGDHQQLMGDEWTEDNLGKLGLVIAQGITSKSYLAGLTQFVDLFAGRPGQRDRILANLMNNQVPLAGLRNELGKLFTPYTRELGSSIGDSIRNRNLISEQLAGGGQLPIKYDVLNGKPIKDHNFFTRAFNAVSPIQLNLDHSPGRNFLFNSGYDLRMSTYFSPSGIDLSDSPLVRSMFQEAIGKQNLEAQLNRLAKQPKIILSLEEYQNDIRSNNRGNYNTKDYYHNKRIKAIFERARKRAWAQLSNHPEVQALITAEKQSKSRSFQKGVSTTNSLLNMYK